MQLRNVALETISFLKKMYLFILFQMLILFEVIKMFFFMI